MAAQNAPLMQCLYWRINGSRSSAGNLGSNIGCNEQATCPVGAHRQQYDDRVTWQPFEVVEQVFVREADEICDVESLLVRRKLTARDLSGLAVKIGRSGDDHHTVGCGLQPLGQFQCLGNVELKNNTGAMYSKKPPAR